MGNSTVFYDFFPYLPKLIEAHMIPNNYVHAILIPRGNSKKPLRHVYDAAVFLFFNGNDVISFMVSKICALIGFEYGPTEASGSSR